jgi:hypothetical protein
MFESTKLKEETCPALGRTDLETTLCQAIRHYFINGAAGMDIQEAWFRAKLYRSEVIPIPTTASAITPVASQPASRAGEGGC